MLQHSLAVRRVCPFASLLVPASAPFTDQSGSSGPTCIAYKTGHTKRLPQASKLASLPMLLRGAGWPTGA